MKVKTKAELRETIEKLTLAIESLQAQMDELRATQQTQGGMISSLYNKIQGLLGQRNQAEAELRRAS